MSLSSTGVQYEALSDLIQSIDRIQKWTTNNKLKLNPSQIDFMVACSTQNRPRVAISMLHEIASDFLRQQNVKT